MENKIKPTVIPPHIVWMAEKIKEAKENGTNAVIICAKRYGLRFAYELAFETQDAELINQKQLSNGTNS